MFAVEEHGRDGHDQAGGSQQGDRYRRWFSCRERCAHSGIIARRGFKLTDAVCPRLVAGHRAE
jgi:hypothetical protein